MSDLEDTFLRESNAIEGVYDPLSLIYAHEAWDYLKQQSYVGIAVIKKTHKILMQNQPIGKKYKGHFRDVDVYIGGRRAMPPGVIRWSLDGWIEKMNDPQLIYGKDIDALHQQIKALHVEYERIHPFIDGNGRTGRMFMNWYAYRCGFPLLIIFEDKRHEYYKWFDDGL